MSKAYDHLFKVLIIGDSGCGKSSILLRFADDTFSQTFVTTIGVDFKIRTIDVNGSKVKLQIWDTAGQERFRTITTTYYRGANGIIIVFDLTSRTSFENVMRWNHEISNNLDSVQILLVGNKVDMTDSRQVSTADGQQLAEKYNIPYFETSAKENVNINEAFDKLANMVLAAKVAAGNANVQPANNVQLNNKKQKKKFC